MEKQKWKRFLPWAVRIVLLFLLLVLTGFAVYFGMQFREVKNQLAYLQDTGNIIQTDVGSLQADIERTLREENSILEDYSIEVTDTDFEAGTYEVFIEAIPKEYTERTRMSIYFGTSEYPLQREGFTFRGEVALPLEESFDGNVTFLIENGEKRNTEVMRDYVGFQEQFDHILSGSMEKTPEYRNGNLSVKGTVDFQLSGGDSYGVQEFSSLQLIAEADREVLYQEELITEDVEPEQIKGAEESVPDKEGTEGNSVVTQTVTGLYGNHYMKIKEEIDSGSEVRIFLRAVSSDGYIFEYEIFKGTAEESGDGFTEEKCFTGEYSVYDRKGGLYIPKNE